MWICLAQWYVDEPGWNLVAKYLKNSVIFGRVVTHICDDLGFFWQGVLVVTVLALARWLNLRVHIPIYIWPWLHTHVGLCFGVRWPLPPLAIIYITTKPNGGGAVGRSN